MKNLDSVRDFYKQVKLEAKFDYALVAEQFEQHNVFANPPQFHKVTLPYLGEVQLTLIAIQQPDYPNKSLSHCKIAQDEGDSELGDGKYKYGSRVSFLAKPTPTLLGAGFKPEYAAAFAGLVDLTCVQGTHNRLFGHPMEHFGGGKWPKKTPAEFCTSNLSDIVKYHRGRFFPEALHEYPFEPGEPVKVFAQDVTKIGGYTRQTVAEKAMDVFSELSDRIYTKERGNVNVCGYVAADSARWVIPAFGKNYVALDAT